MSLLATSFLPRSVFFFNDTATTEIYTLSLHDALPIPRRCGSPGPVCRPPADPRCPHSGRSPLTCVGRSEEHTSELQSHSDLVCRLLLEKKKKKQKMLALCKKKTRTK